MTRARFNSFFFGAATIIAAFLLCGGAQADSIVVTKGAQSITGEPMGFDGVYLRLLTSDGEVSVDMRGTQCAGTTCPDVQNFVPLLRMSGAARLSDVLLPGLIEGYARAQGYRALRRNVDDTHFEYDVVNAQTGAPILRFAFHVSDTDQGFSDLLADRADAVLAAREVRPEEAEQAREAGFGDLLDARHAQIVALDAFVPIVGRASTQTSISVEQLRQVLRGEAADVPYDVHLPRADDQVLGELYERLNLDAVPEQAQRHADWRDLSMAVALTREAIGIVPYKEQGIARALDIGGACGLRAQADLEGLKTEDYPFVRPLFIYWPARRVSPALASWRSWLFSAQAQLITQRAGFVDRGMREIPLARQGERLGYAIRQAGDEVSLDDLQQMLQRLEGLTRWSITFRFTPGSTRLDAQSRSNLLQLARGLRDGDFAGKRVVLVGFSDGQGPAAANKSLSFARAESVLRDLRGVLANEIPEDVSIGLEAFGEALPLACDDSEWGRFSNRRVELWVGPVR